MNVTSIGGCGFIGDRGIIALTCFCSILHYNLSYESYPIGLQSVGLGTLVNHRMVLRWATDISCIGSDHSVLASSTYEFLSSFIKP